MEKEQEMSPIGRVSTVVGLYLMDEIGIVPNKCTIQYVPVCVTVLHLSAVLGNY